METLALCLWDAKNFAKDFPRPLDPPKRYRKKEYKSATYFSEKVLERNPNNTMAYYLKGRANHKQGHFREALKNYNFTINLSPDFGEGYFHRSAVKLYLKDNKSACADLRKAVDLNVEGAKEALRKNCR